MRERSMWVSAVLAAVLLLAAGAVQAQTTPAQTPAAPGRPSSAGEGAPAPALKAMAPAPPTGQAARYVIPYYTSQTLLSGARSVTMVDVYNQSGVACDVGVQFQFAFGTTNICSITLSIPPKQSRLFCSRPVNDPLFPCTVSCPGTGLTFNTGHAFVSSTNDANFDCARIAIHPQLAFTRDAADDQVEATTQLTIVEINSGNRGD
jgi:hypothetical protein